MIWCSHGSSTDQQDRRSPGVSAVGVEPASYATIKRRLPIYARPSWRQSLATASAAHAGLGPASLVLFDVSTLYFETDAGDGFANRVFQGTAPEPQITLGLLTDASGFPLTVEAFEGSKAETATMLPVINAFKAAHRLTDVTVVADAGMISEATRSRCRPRGCRSSSAPGSRLCLTWCGNGVTNTPTSRSPTGWC